MSRLLCIALVSTVAACHGGKAPATVGNTTPSGSAASSGPTSAELVAMVRSSTLPTGGECNGMAQEKTVGAAYAAYAEAQRSHAMELKLPFIEQGSCRPEPSGRSAWSC